MSPFIKEKAEPQHCMKTKHSTEAAFKIVPVKVEPKDISETSEIDCTDSNNRSKCMSLKTDKSEKAAEQNHNFSCNHSEDYFISLNSISDLQKIVNNKVEQLLQCVVNQKAEITSLKTQLMALRSRNLNQTQDKLCVLPIANLDSKTSSQDIKDENSCIAKDNIAFTTPPDYLSTRSSPLSTALLTSPTLPVDSITAQVLPAVSTASTSKCSVTSFVTNRSKCKRGRPTKEHADGPDPQLMAKMTSHEVKVYKSRVLNNESSRISRRKRQMRLENEIKEEEALQAKNKRLRAKLHRLLHRSHMAKTLLGQLPK